MQDNKKKIPEALSAHLRQAFDRELMNVLGGNVYTTSVLRPPQPAPDFAAMLEAAVKERPAPPAIRIHVRDAQQQRRTPQDVRGPWKRPGRVPSKANGRKGTRRAWKRAHPPCWTWLYREPTDMLTFVAEDGYRHVIVTPRQANELEREIDHRNRSYLKGRDLP